MVAPFCKAPIEATLTGVTNIPHDPSLDMIIQSWLPIYKSVVGLSASASTKSIFGNVDGIVPINKVDTGKVYRIRGIAWSCRVSSSYGQQLICGAKSLLNQFLSDVYITLDHRKGQYSGQSPGFGLTLWAERKDGGLYSAEAMSEPEGGDNVLMDAETIGKLAASRLLDQKPNNQSTELTKLSYIQNIFLVHSTFHFESNRYNLSGNTEHAPTFHY
ncbi:unnamed protein product [Heterobilharzia americana]|nr:unnamed protein product [Heterobilharzia americana]